MAKTVVINTADNTSVQFLRGILTRSLQNAGVPFDDAYQLASYVRRELDDIDEISNSELRALVVRHLQGLPYQDALERYQTKLKVPAPIMVRDASDETVPFSRSRLQQRLECSSMSTEEAADITSVVYDRLLQEEKVEISSNLLATLTYGCIKQAVGVDYAHRYLSWLEFSRSGRPLLLLIGGAAATGKSTIATEMASRLEIVRAQSTDMLRQVMRMMIPERLLPVLHTSSFNAWKTLSEEGRDRMDKDELVANGYLQQAKLIDVACEAVIERALQERVSLVLEGVHVLPSLRKKIPEDTDALVVPITLAVLKRDHLRRHIKGRGMSTPQRRSERYLENFEDIWQLQTYILSEADRAHTPIVVNHDKETAIHELMGIIGDRLVKDLVQSPEEVLMKLCGHGEHDTLPGVPKPSAQPDKVKTKRSWFDRFRSSR
jgi:2-phosphoglycerate kinase